MYSPFMPLIGREGRIYRAWTLLFILGKRFTRTSDLGISVNNVRAFLCVHVILYNNYVRVAPDTN